jgi:uncharacterized protein (TIGR02266 family)
MRDVASQFREYVRLDRLRRSGGLTPDQLARWKLYKRSLGKHFSPGLSDAQADQRESVRVPTRMRVSFASEGALARVLMTNLSRMGLFVQADHLLEIGTRLQLRVHVDSPPRDIEIPVEVVSHNVGPRFENAAQGMGLRFLDMSPDVEKEVSDLYERLIR